MCGKFRVAIAINLRNYVPAGSLDRFKFTHKTWLNGYNGRFYQTFLWNVYIADHFSTNQTSRWDERIKKCPVRTPGW